MTSRMTGQTSRSQWFDAAETRHSSIGVEGGTYKIPSCRIGVVNDRLTVKSGSGPALIPLRMPATEAKRRENSGVADHAVDDATLACAGLAGHAWAQREIWFRFAPMIFAFLRRTLGTRHDPEDLLQEVFLRVFDRLGTLENPAALRSFIFSFAIRVVREKLRRHSIRARLAQLFLGPSSETSVPHVDFEARELLRRIQTAMDRMNERNRAVFVLRRFEGLELTEIAESLGMSLATVKRDLDKANKHLSKSIDRDDRLRIGLEVSLPAGPRARGPRESGPRESGR